MKTVRPFLLAWVLSALCPAASAGVTAGVDQTFGSGNYRATKVKASFDLSESLYLSPSYSQYRSDYSSGTRRGLGARLGYEEGLWSWGLEGAHQPRVDGYARSSFGGDAAYSLLPGGEDGVSSSEDAETFGWGLAGVDLGAGLTRTMHSDQFQAAGARMGGHRPPGPARTETFSIGQTDFSAFASAKFLAATFSGGVTKSHYDKTLDLGDARVIQALESSGLDGVAQGFPDLSFDLKLVWKTLPFVRPHVSWVRTSFRLGDPPSDGIEFGGVAEAGRFKVKASWERYTQAGSPKLDYFTLGSSVSF